MSEATTATSTSETRTVRSLQNWPGGGTWYVSGNAEAPAGSRDALQIHPKFYGPDNDGREATGEERRAVKVQEAAELYLSREVYVCDSALVDALLKGGDELPGDMRGAFTWEEVRNLRPDPSEWDMAKCREWLDDNGHDAPDDNPYTLDREGLIRELHGVDIADELEAADCLRVPCDLDGVPEGMSEDAAAVAAASEEAIRETLVEWMDEGAVKGLEDWRDAVRDNATDEDVFQWFRVSDWLADKLEEIGEPVLRNDYGDWWGRTCCGQMVIMDGTLQKVAEHVEQELDRLIPNRGK